MIVRLMKARKRLSHNDLMSEVMAQLRWDDSLIVRCFSNDVQICCSF